MQDVFRASKGELNELLASIKSKRIFLVRGGSSYENSGAKDFMDKNFPIKGEFYSFDINPQMADLKKGIKLFKEGDYDFIIAIGGGSTLDMAKLISVFAHQENDYLEILQDNQKINTVKTPLLAIPTTSGTGAEATAFSVLYVDKKKYSVASETMLPNYVYLSSQFTVSASKYLSACTGADAFCQAIESVWSVNSTIESERYALQAVEMIWHHLKKAVDMNDDESKAMMLEASFLAGKAINITKTTAPHAISYAFTSYYGIPHGHAVSLSLPHFFEFNYNVSQNDCVDKKGSESVKQRLEKLMDMMGINKKHVKFELTTFFKSIGLNANISSLTNHFEPQIIIDNVNLQRLQNNPRRINDQDIRYFLALSSS